LEAFLVRRAAVVLSLAFVILAGAYIQTIGAIAQEPIWAYGFSRLPAYDEPARRRRTFRRAISVGMKARRASCARGTWKAARELLAARNPREGTRHRHDRRRDAHRRPGRAEDDGVRAMPWSDLMGKDDAPPLARRSASYLARQLYDFQRETRLGRLAPLMRVVVTNLTDEDMLAITAYLASLQPVRGSQVPQRPPAVSCR
jgi:hypothetical protein